MQWTCSIGHTSNQHIGKNFFTNSTSDRGLLSKINKNSRSLSSNQHNQKQHTELNRELTTEKSQIAEKHLKKCSKSLMIREKWMKLILRFYHTPIRNANIKNSGESTCWRGGGERGMNTPPFLEGLENGTTTLEINLEFYQNIGNRSKWRFS